MLTQVAEELDSWIVRRNVEAHDEGVALIASCEIKLVGQQALVELAAPLTLAATTDVDVRANYSHAVEQEFGRLLARRGKSLDPLGREIWMPRETHYTELFAGPYVTLRVADIDSVLVFKALKAPEKNHALIVEYLAKSASTRFLSLAAKYQVDLERFL